MKETKNKDQYPFIVHIWVGIFNSDEELVKYAHMLMKATDEYDIEWNYFKEEKALENLIFYLPIDVTEVMTAAGEKYPKLEKANSYLAVFGCEGKQAAFEKLTSNETVFYLGEFESPEPELDAPYHPWV